MKRLIVIMSVLLISFFVQNAFAGPGCTSCAAVESCSDAYTEKSCSDGTCDSVEPDHKNGKESKKESTAADEPAKVNTSGLKTLIDSGVPMIILDARASKDVEASKIPGALALNAGSKAEDIAKILPDKEALVVTYCANIKCPASTELYQHLQSLGYSNLLKYPEGFQGWVEAGHPVKSAR